MVVQMDIVWRTLCVLSKRRRKVYHTETINTYNYNRDVPMPLNGVGVPERSHCIALRAVCNAMPSPQLQKGRRYEAASIRHVVLLNLTRLPTDAIQKISPAPRFSSSAIHIQTTPRFH